MRAAAAALTLLAAACGTGFEDPSIVIDLRVLSMSVEPPEVILDFDLMNPEESLEGLEIPPVTLTALVADPGDERQLAYTIDACPPSNVHRCDDPSVPIQRIDFGVIDDPEGPDGSTMLTTTFTIQPQVLQESVRLDDLAGFGGVVVELHMVVYPNGDPDLSRAVHATKIMLYSPRLPAERVANSNPRLEALILDEDPEAVLPMARCNAPGGVPIPVAAATELRLDPVEPEGVREDYLLPTFDGDVREITENLSYIWFATGGNFVPGESGGPIDAFGNEPPLYTRWTTPAEPGLHRLWVVQRDERGGQSWAEYCFDVGGAP